MSGQGGRKCKVCGCTDEDCSVCMMITGAPCFWIFNDLCSRCFTNINDLAVLLRYFALSHGLVNKALWSDLVAVVLNDLIPGDLLAEEAKAREDLNMR